jgi:hypothetical protein
MQPHRQQQAVNKSRKTAICVIFADVDRRRQLVLASEIRVAVGRQLLALALMLSGSGK